MYKYFLSFCVFFFALVSGKAQGDSTLNFEVYFPLDESRLTATQKSKVDSVLEIAPLSIVKKLVIYGHTDSLAGIEYNRKLSKERVLRILEYFVLKGLDPLKARTDFYGEERPKYDNGPQERFKNRRCEVWLSIDRSLLPQPEQKLSDLQLKKGDKLRIPNLNFVGNQPVPVWESMPALEDLTRLMKRNPDLKVSIQGHVCCADDQELSTARAFTVYSFLLANGISRSRMSYEGYSNREPLFRERTEKERALNRRVELEVRENSARRADVDEAGEAILDLRAPVLNIKFFQNSARLKPSGDFMLGLVAEMMAESEGLQYEFYVYDNINNSTVTGQRARALEKLIRRKGVAAEKVKVHKASPYKDLPISTNDNYIVVQIRPLKT